MALTCPCCKVVLLKPGQRVTVAGWGSGRIAIFHPQDHWNVPVKLDAGTSMTVARPNVTTAPEDWPPLM